MKNDVVSLCANYSFSALQIRHGSARAAVEIFPSVTVRSALGYFSLQMNVVEIEHSKMELGRFN